VSWTSPLVSACASSSDETVTPISRLPLAVGNSGSLNEAGQRFNFLARQDCNTNRPAECDLLEIGIFYLQRHRSTANAVGLAIRQTFATSGVSSTRGFSATILAHCDAVLCQRSESEK
jgi:predicted component of type VI protein secretion system